MLDSGTSIKDVISIYENFVEQKFKNHPNFRDIRQEFSSFKNEVLEKNTKLDDAQFSQYAIRKKLSLKNNALQPQLNQQRINDQNEQDFGERSAGFRLFQIIKEFSDDIYGLDSYLSSFRIHNPEDLVNDWNADDEQIPVDPSSFFDSIKSTSQLQDLNSHPDNLIYFLAKNEKKEHFRLLLLGKEHSFTDRLFFSIFISLIERKLAGFSHIVEYFTSMYNISHHFGLKTEYFLLFNNLCKYFQFILYNVMNQQLEESSMYQPYVLHLIGRTANNRKIVKAVKHLLIEMVKIILQYTSDRQLRSILSLYSGEDLSSIKNGLDSYMKEISSGLIGARSELNLSDPRERQMIQRMIPIICFGFSSDFSCTLVVDINNTCSITYSLCQDSSYPVLIHNANPNYVVSLYSREDHILVEELRQWERLLLTSKSTYNEGSSKLQQFPGQPYKTTKESALLKLTIRGSKIMLQVRIRTEKILQIEATKHQEEQSVCLKTHFINSTDSEYQGPGRLNHYVIEDSSKIELSKNPLGSLDEYGRSKISANSFGAGGNGVITAHSEYQVAVKSGLTLSSQTMSKFEIDLQKKGFMDKLQVSLNFNFLSCKFSISNQSSSSLQDLIFAIRNNSESLDRLQEIQRRESAQFIQLRSERREEILESFTCILSLKIPNQPQFNFQPSSIRQERF